MGMSLLKGENMRRDEARDAWRRGMVRQNREAAAMYFDKAMECEEGDRFISYGLLSLRNGAPIGEHLGCMRKRASDSGHEACEGGENGRGNGTEMLC